MDQKLSFTWTSWKNSLNKGVPSQNLAWKYFFFLVHHKKNFIFHSTCFKLINTDCKTSKIAFMRKGKVSPPKLSKKSWTFCFWSDFDLQNYIKNVFLDKMWIVENSVSGRIQLSIFTLLTIKGICFGTKRPPNCDAYGSAKLWSMVIKVHKLFKKEFHCVPDFTDQIQ